ncbi:DUF378 domain-containing protein [Candidatus Kaiserbacteria bacterium CG10_big_fil_rev_8_21_14_0_10_59_10]|uniref:DUF378 domain-containing protein n=1 Tax=Candidatus Kaiserbacteria bacterium CG10_big_fil_rev_8_21_14_0_10_59_10 TaxID=1974612 RepID=A0A2H0U6Z1_9BACT|nr:MAG: DUF378 domain-containing protein [Candidatus Kaiserbacteria bacterium CG10_big_fil_rev_8_21_14_0_10_59_10]
MKYLHIATFSLVIIGGVNWMLLALTGWEIGALFGGMDALLSKAIYVLVGLSAVYLAVMHKRACRECSVEEQHSAPMGAAM